MQLGVGLCERIGGRFPGTRGKRAGFNKRGRVISDLLGFLFPDRADLGTRSA
jgi:hypothetical protein